MWRDSDFRELCEHLAYMCRLEDDMPDASGKHFTELRQSLEIELLEWLRHC